MKTRVQDWIKPLRPAACLLGFFVSMASWAIAYSRIDFVAVFSSMECFWYLACTMVTNNWFDRHHDAKKNPPNDFALRNEGKFLWFMISCWSIEVVLVYALYAIHPYLAILATFRVVVGFFYSWTRTVPYLPAATVAIDSSLCTVTPAMVGGPNHGMWILLTATAFLMIGRETLKDIEDYVADFCDGKPYKATIAVMKGPNVARIAARLSIVFGSLIFLSMPLSILPMPAAWSGIACLIALACSAYLAASSYLKAKAFLDGGMATFLILLNSSYWLLRLLKPIHDLTIQPQYCMMGFFAFIAFMLAKPEMITRWVQSGLDNGKEKLEKLNQSHWLWPSMYGLFWLVILVSRLICSQVNGITDFVNSLITATTLTLALIVLVVVRVPHVRVEGRSYGYTVIERLSVGIVIGFFFTFCHLTGLPLPVVVFIIPLVSIIDPRLESLCHLLRSYSCVLGIITGVAIVEGIVFASVSILPVYLVIVGIYFLWRRYRVIPVYTPNSKLGGIMIKLGFVAEGVVA